MFIVSSEMMIRRLSYCLLAVLLLGVSCSREQSAPDRSGIEISVYCCDPVSVKSGSDETRDGEDKYNENLIQSVDFFFYPGQNPDRNSDAVFHVHRESGQRGSDVFLLDLTQDDVNTKIFPVLPSNVHHATVFAIANYRGTLVSDELDLSGTSLNELEAIEVETDFVLTPPPPETYPNYLSENYKQDDFMMSGKTVIDLLSRTSNIVAKGSIELIRYASKMTISISVAESVNLGNSVWEPMLEDMAIYLVNGVNTVALGGEDTTPQYFSYVDNKKKFAYRDSHDGDKLKPLVSKTGKYFNTFPMYFYPQHWQDGETKLNTYSAEPYLKLELPWHRTTEGGYSSTQRQCYYKIFIPLDNRGPEYLRHFVRNNWYHMDIDVGLLGAETDDAAVTLEGSFYIVPWQNVNREIDRMAEIGSARYLSVDRDHYELHNLNTATIRYTSSHPVEIKDIRVTCPYYGEKSPDEEARGGVIRKVTSDDDIYPKDTYYLDYDKAHRKAMDENNEDWLTDIGTAIQFFHKINNDYTDRNFDYSPFTVSFTIAHKDLDDERYKKTITLIQTPAIYISSLPNSDTTFIYTGLKNGKDGVYYSKHWGYVYVDGRQIVRAEARKDAQDKWEEYPEHNASITSTYMSYFKNQYPDDDAVQGFDAEDFHWRVVWYTGGGRDMFKINVTVLPEESDLVIGDPRTDDWNPSYRDFFKVADALGESEPRSLRWYYPAEKSARTANMLAPSFRISTKCGGTEFGDLTEQQAKWRCASYQEDGFPAGRWRLPTRGEVKFIAQLSANGAFARLFSDNGKYWSANGAIQLSGTSVNDISVAYAMTRCVYDVWYWGDEQQENRAHFYWGDKER